MTKERQERLLAAKLPREMKAEAARKRGRPAPPESDSDVVVVDPASGSTRGRPQVGPHRRVPHRPTSESKRQSSRRERKRRLQEGLEAA